MLDFLKLTRRRKYGVYFIKDKILTFNLRTAPNHPSNNEGAEKM
jgi:hypothetical protein